MAKPLKHLNIVGDGDDLEVLEALETAFNVSLSDEQVGSCLTAGDLYQAISRASGSSIDWQTFTSLLEKEDAGRADQIRPETFLIVEGDSTRVGRWFRSLIPRNLKVVRASSLIKTLGLKPHPEGGHYAETFRDPATVDGRSVGTAIYYLLQAGERSHWHRVDAAEIWHYYAGAPLLLRIGKEKIHLGPDVLNGERPQAVVPAGVWQSAESTGAYTLVGCTVSPGFEFDGFEMAPENFTP